MLLLAAAASVSATCKVPVGSIWSNVSDCRITANCQFQCQQCGRGPCSCDLGLCPTADLRLVAGELECVSGEAGKGTCAELVTVPLRRRLRAEAQSENDYDENQEMGGAGDSYMPSGKDYKLKEKEEEKFGEMKDKYGVEEDFCPCNEYHCMMKPGYERYGRKGERGRRRRRLKEEEEDGGEDEEEDNPFIGAGYCVRKLYRPKMPVFATPPGYYKILPNVSYGSRQLLIHHKVEGENEKKNPEDYVCPPNSKPCEEEEEEEEELSIFELGKSINVVLCSICMICIIVATMMLEEVLEIVAEKLKPFFCLDKIRLKIIEELTILGFLSFTLTIIVQIGLIPEGSALLESVEFSHVLIFFMAMFIVFQAVNVGLASSRIKRRWEAFANESKLEIFMKFPDYESIQAIKSWDDERWAMLRWIILKAVFLRFHEKELIQKHIQREELQKLGKELKTEEEEEEEEESRKRRGAHVHEQREHEEEGHRATTPEEMEIIEKFDYAKYLDFQIDFVVIDFMNFEKITWCFALVCCTFLAVLYGPCHSSLVKALERMVGIWVGSTNGHAQQLLEAIGSMPEPYIVVEDPEWFKNNVLSGGQKPFEIPAPNIEREQILRCFPGRDPEYLKIMLDIVQIWNCFLLGLYLMEFINNAILNGTPEWIVIMPLPSLFSVLILGPKILRNYALLHSVACLDINILRKTFQYMDRKHRLMSAVKKEIRAALYKKIVANRMPKIFKSELIILHKFFEGMDVDGNGSLSSNELRDGFAEIFGLHYTDEEWPVVVREVDPDQSNHVDLEEFEEVLYGEGKVPTNAQLQKPIPKPDFD